MDRNDRIAVLGTWPCHERPHDSRRERTHDPKGWCSHHQSFRAEHGKKLTPAELVDAIQARAYEIWQRRVRAGSPGNPLDDWLIAEHEIIRRQAEICGGQGAHPAVPPRRSH